MELRSILLYSISVVWLIASVLVVTFITFPEISKNQRTDLDKIIDTINSELICGEIQDTTIKKIPDKFLFILWQEDGVRPGVWHPIISDKSIKPDNFKSPLTVANSDFSSITGIYKKNTSDFNYIVWYYKFHISYIIKHIFIPILVLVVFYLIIMLFIYILPLNSSEEPDNFEMSNNNHSTDSYEDIVISNSYSNDNNKNSDNSEPIINEAVNKEVFNDTNDIKLKSALLEYKDLWIKDFKISDNFKNNFPFNLILEKVRFITTPEVYLKSVLNTAKLFFGWTEYAFYISQANGFIEVFTKNQLNTNEINIPLKGDQKGDLFIPLYPYNATDLYGYLKFNWTNNERFYIADLLYFLKYIFSDSAKQIFTGDKLRNEVIKKFSSMIEKKKSRTPIAAFIQTDNIHTFSSEIKSTWKEILDSKIYQNLILKFKEHSVVKISSFNYIITGVVDDFTEFALDLEKWLEDDTIHSYEVSKEYGVISMSYSSGVAQMTGELCISEDIIKLAEDKAIRASKQGGNQLIV